MLDVIAMTPIGARLTGLRGRHRSIERRRQDLRHLLAEHGVLVLPAQHIDDDGFLRFLRSFGPTMFTVGEIPVPGHPELNVVSNVGRAEPPRSTFHTDTSYVRKPPAYHRLTGGRGAGARRTDAVHQPICRVRHVARRRPPGAAGAHDHPRGDRLTSRAGPGDVGRSSDFRVHPVSGAPISTCRLRSVAPRSAACRRERAADIVAFLFTTPPAPTTSTGTPGRPGMS